MLLFFEMLFSAPSCPWKWWWCLWKCRFLVLMLQKDPLVFEWSTIIISYSLCRPCIGSVYRWFSYNLSDKNWFQSLPTKMHVQNSWRKKSKQDNPFNSKKYCSNVLHTCIMHFSFTLSNKTRTATREKNMKWLNVNFFWLSMKMMIMFVKM